MGTTLLKSSRARRKVRIRKVMRLVAEVVRAAPDDKLSLFFTIPGASGPVLKNLIPGLDRRKRREKPLSKSTDFTGQQRPADRRAARRPRLRRAHRGRHRTAVFAIGPWHRLRPGRCARAHERPWRAPQATDVPKPVSARRRRLRPCEPGPRRPGLVAERRRSKWPT